MADEFRSILAPAVADERGVAFEKAIARMERIDLKLLHVKDFDTVDVSALPALVWQYDMGDYVSDDSSELEIRALLKLAIPLRRYAGTPFAVKTALATAGIQADVVEWWQETPKATPNTFKLIAWVHDNLGGDDVVLSERRIELVHRYINAANRHSQDFEFQVGVSTSATLSVGAGVEMAQICMPPSVEAAYQPDPVGLGLGVAAAGQAFSAVTTLCTDLGYKPDPVQLEIYSGSTAEAFSAWRCDAVEIIPPLVSTLELAVAAAVAPVTVWQFSAEEA